MLPVPYFLVTFTVPSELRRLFYSHQQLLYNLLFAQSAGALQDVAARPKYLGAELGLLGILQTWTRDLRYHPHVHYLVPGGGLRSDGLRWIRCPTPTFLLPERVLAARFRSRFNQALSELSAQLMAPIPKRIWASKWVVDILPVGSGEAALKYLSAYLYKTAITSQRLISSDDQQVCWAYRQAQTGQWVSAQLKGPAFIARFLQHVLPKGFQRVRYFGWRAAAAAKKRERILALLNWKPPPAPARIPLPIPLCPQCHQSMLCLGPLARPPPDTS